MILPATIILYAGRAHLSRGGMAAALNVRHYHTLLGDKTGTSDPLKQTWHQLNHGAGNHALGIKLRGD